MIRHSLNYALWKLTKEVPMRFDNEILGKTIQYLNSLDFHKRLRNGLCKQYKLNGIVEVKMQVITIV